MAGTVLGELIRDARKRAGLRLEDVAEEVGVTAGALSHIESGRRLPNPHNAVRIAEVLGMPSEDVLTALDHEHSSRRRGSIDSQRSMQGSMPEPSAVYSSLPIEALFTGSRDEVDAIEGARRVAQSAPPSPSSARSSVGPTRSSMASRALTTHSSARATARWSEVTQDRIVALDELATTASEAIRTLRGLLGDDDPAVAHEAARLLRELEVRGPNE